MKADPLIFVGGGLAGGLAALALHRRRPDVPILLIEAAASFGGNHTWSCFETDIPTDAQWLVDELCPVRWPAHRVRFPQYERRIEIGYLALASTKLHAALIAGLPAAALRLSTPVEAIAPDHVVLQGGERLAAMAVIDCRGPEETVDGMELAWQKFVGCDYALSSPRSAIPTIMDATVEQTDGYRFIYTLPLSAQLWLLEDTYYSLDKRLDRTDVRARVEAAARDAGIAGSVVREESGVLPIVIDGKPERFWPRSEVARLGLRAGLFHPTTGYSFGLALKAAVDLAELPLPCGPAQLADWTRNLFMRNWRGTGFYRTLNQLMFRAGAPGERFRVLEHFYRLDAALIARFYAGRLTSRDKLKILSGKPPVPVTRAVGALLGRRAAWQT